jgi:hypothetical protein
MIPGVYQGAEGAKIGDDFAPSANDVAAMMRFNEDLAKAGALISLDGLQPPSTGARVSYQSGIPTVTDGPFAESKEVIGGYWMIRANSREEAIEWAKRVPASPRDIVEVRQVFEMSDFPEDVRKAADSPTVREAVGRDAA